MKYIIGYNQFIESKPIKEEFISKLFRDITGKNKKRIEEVLILLDVKKRKEDLERSLSELPDFQDKEKFLTKFNNLWKSKVDEVFSQTQIIIITEIKYIYEDSIEKLSQDLKEKISELDDEDFKNLCKLLKKNELPITEAFFNATKNEIVSNFISQKKQNIGETTFGTNLSILTYDGGRISRRIGELKYIIQYENILYWGDFLGENFKTDEMPEFVRALCLFGTGKQRYTNKYDEYFRPIDFSDISLGYDSYVLNRWGGWTEFIERINRVGDESVISLENFKDLERDVDSIRNKLKDFNKEVEDNNDMVKNMSLWDKSFDYDQNKFSIDDNQKKLELNYDKENPIVLRNQGMDAVSSLNPWEIVKNFDQIKSLISDKKVKDLVDLDSEHPSIYKVKEGSNVLYHGGKFDKNDPNWLIDLQGGIFCTKSLSGAQIWGWEEKSSSLFESVLSEREKTSTSISNRVYEFTIKPGSKMYNFGPGGADSGAPGGLKDERENFFKDGIIGLGYKADMNLTTKDCELESSQKREFVLFVADGDVSCRVIPFIEVLEHYKNFNYRDKYQEMMSWYKGIRKVIWYGYKASLLDDSGTHIFDLDNINSRDWEKVSVFYFKSNPKHRSYPDDIDIKKCDSIIEKLANTFETRHARMFKAMSSLDEILELCKTTK